MARFLSHMIVCLCLVALSGSQSLNACQIGSRSCVALEDTWRCLGHVGKRVRRGESQYHKEPEDISEALKIDPMVEQTADSVDESGRQVSYTLGTVYSTGQWAMRQPSLLIHFLGWNRGHWELVPEPLVTRGWTRV